MPLVWEVEREWWSVHGPLPRGQLCVPDLEVVWFQGAWGAGTGPQDRIAEAGVVEPGRRVARAWAAPILSSCRSRAGGDAGRHRITAKCLSQAVENGTSFLPTGVAGNKGL